MLVKRSFLIVISFLFLAIPPTLQADYLYPDSAGLQTLAIIEPVTPDSLFHTWTGDIGRTGLWNLGSAIDLFRNTDNSDDWDVIFKITGAYSPSQNILTGITIPYIVRDPEFNESDMLDLRAFVRGEIARSGFAGELSVILPTADEGTLFPFTLNTTVPGLRLAYSSGSEELTFGVNLGYQKYLKSVSGEDSDLLYGLWFEKSLRETWDLVAEVSGSTHTHSGALGDDKVTEGNALVGVRKSSPKGLQWGFAAGVGLADSVYDLRATTTATIVFSDGKGPKRVDKKVKKKKAVKTKRAVSPTPGTIVVVMIAEGVTDSATEKSVTKALQKKSYATGMDPDPGIKGKGKNILYYTPGMQEQAISVSRVLVFGGHLKDLQIEETGKPLGQNSLLLVLGGAR
ncbi:MAG: hypothetical protein P1S46_10585 [bacterium]|nr:hypothetical protein [bacterium]MDT8284976.1 hypothetical protein [Thermovirgaceae bacterium]